MVSLYLIDQGVRWMGLRINTNIASQEVQKNLRTTSAAQESEFAKLSSGKRINKSADDAAGLAISKKLEAGSRGMRMATRNANDAISLVQVAEGGLNETSNILTRLRELSIQAGSDTVGEEERGYLSMEYEQLVSEADRISKTTAFNGRSLLNGTGEMLSFQIGAYEGADNVIEMDTSFADSSAESLGIDGTNIRDRDDARSNLERIDSAIGKVSAFRANYGSIQARLQSTINNLDVATLNQEAARSRIEDVDIADSTAKLASAQIRSAAGVATLAQANQLGTQAMRLIG